MNLLRARPLPNAARPLGNHASCSQVGRHSRSWARTRPPQASVAGDQKTDSRWSEVWMGSMPLDGFDFVVEILPGPLASAASLHSFVALKSQNTKECLLLDFLPLNPQSPMTVVSLFSGGSTEGNLRIRKLPRWIKGRSIKTWSWDPKLTLLTHNCSHYSEALVKHLAVRKNIAIT
eukprot:gene14390-20392_t